MHRLTFKSHLLILLGFLGLLGAQRPKPSYLEQKLRGSQWQKRVLLVAAPTADHTDFREQKSLLASKRAELASRDFLVLDVVYSQLSNSDKQFLAQEIGIQPTRFAAVLIGKDGGVKIKSARPIAPAALFGTVDKMPMRQQEMRRGVVEN